MLGAGRSPVRSMEIPRLRVVEFGGSGVSCLSISSDEGTPGTLLSCANTGDALNAKTRNAAIRRVVRDVAWLMPDAIRLVIRTLHSCRNLSSVSGLCLQL